MPAHAQDPKAWQARKAAGDLIIELAEGRPLLCAGDYSEVAKGLAKMAKGDPNASVVASAVKAMKALAVPLGRDFGSYARKLAPVLIEKGAEKDKVRRRPHLPALSRPLARETAALGAGRGWRPPSGRRSRASRATSASGSPT